MPEEFKTFVMKILHEHDKMHVMKKKMEVEVTPKFYNLFQNSETLSSKWSLVSSSDRGEREILKHFKEHQKEKTLRDGGW